MSDEPSDAQKLIAEVVRKHRLLPGTVTGPQYCSCVWSGLDYPAHVAAEVDKALGRLQREVLADYNSKPWRWVSSGWTVTE